MAPPFFAYYGVFTDELELVKEAVRQCELYRDALGTAQGPWRHIVNMKGPEPDLKSDPGLWSTSNAWAAAGMARVLATLRNSEFRRQTESEQKLLVHMIQEIVDGAIALDTDASGLLRNYLDEQTWSGEVAGTGLFAAVVFRMAVLEPQTFGSKYPGWACQKLEIVGRCIDVESGIAAPVVNSLKEGQAAPLDGINPEGQAFIVLLYAAWRDWTSASSAEMGRESTLPRKGMDVE